MIPIDILVSRSKVKVIGNIGLRYHVQHIQESFAPGQRSSLFSNVGEGEYKYFFKHLLYSVWLSIILVYSIEYESFFHATLVDVSCK